MKIKLFPKTRNGLNVVNNHGDVWTIDERKNDDPDWIRGRSNVNTRPEGILRWFHRKNDRDFDIEEVR